MLPYISIIIPTYNRPRALARCLASLDSVDYPRERFDVVVVDDGSNSSLRDIIAKYSTCYRLYYLRQHNQGPATARNAGAEYAQGEFLAFIDDDCVMEPAWLREMARATAMSVDSLFGGHTTNALKTNIYSSASQTLVDFLYGYFLVRKSPLRFFTSNNLMMRRKPFLEIGGFHGGFPLAAAEDRELSFRWISRGGDLQFVPDAIVLHHHDMGFRSYLRQHFNYGRGALHFRRVVGNRASGGIFPQSLNFYYALLKFPVVDRRIPVHGLTGLLILSQLANCMGVLWEFLATKRLMRILKSG